MIAKIQKHTKTEPDMKLLNHKDNATKHEYITACTFKRHGSLQQMSFEIIPVYLEPKLSSLCRIHI